MPKTENTDIIPIKKEKRILAISNPIVHKKIEELNADLTHYNIEGIVGLLLEVSGEVPEEIPEEEGIDSDCI